MPRNIIAPQRGLGTRFSGDLPDNDKRTQPTRYGRRPETRLQQALRQLRRRRKSRFPT